MFIRMFNIEERKYFWTLINYVANCDNELSSEEKIIMDTYKKEIGIKNLELIHDNFEHIVEALSKSTSKVKNAIFVEVFALVLSDNRFVSSEKEVIDILQKSFSISDEKKNKYYDWILKTNKLYKDIYVLIS